MTSKPEMLDGVWMLDGKVLGRPDQDGWIAWHGGKNPIPGVRVDVRLRDGREGSPQLSDQWDGCWYHIPGTTGATDIIAYRPHVASPASSSSVVQGDASGRIKRAKPGWLKRSLDEVQAEKGPGGWLINSSDGVWEWTGVRIAAVAAMTEGLPVWSVTRSGYEPTDTPREERLESRCQRCGGEIQGWLCQSCPAEFRENENGYLVFDDVTAAPVSRPAGEGEREAGDYTMALAERQAFEGHTDLAAHIERMATTGRIGSMVEWDGFLRSLNAALLSPAAPDAGGGKDRMQMAVEALERIAAATPGNTNSASARDAFSWTAAVSNTALSALQPGSER